jgi:tetratricopeptide (TPR) repeat protein
MTIRPAGYSTGVPGAIHPVPIAAVLGILTAALATHLLIAPGQQDLATRPLVNQIVAETAIPFEAWPMCSSMASLDPDFAAGKRAMAAGNWNVAIKALTSAGLRDARNPDIQDYLGDVYRRLRQSDRAMQYYERALALNPRHRSAHQHLGEAHLLQGDLAKASEHLATLERICLIQCEEYDDLKQAIAGYGKLGKR